MSARRSVLPIILLAALLSLLGETSIAQQTPSNLHLFLLEHVGQEVLMMDRTGGGEQFVGGEASKAYAVILDSVKDDYIVVRRATQSDKRSFIYPMSVIRRIIFAYDRKPYKKIVLEMY
ncbi:MAG: hypothetical protein WBD30_10290 [Bacteroidota bacterium]